MKIALTSLFVDDQRAALAFYTDVLGFTKRHDIPLGDDFWLTVVSPESPDGPELLLEPSGHPAVKPYRDALAEDGIRDAQESRGLGDVYKRQGHDCVADVSRRLREHHAPAGQPGAVSYTHLTLPTICSV